MHIIRRPDWQISENRVTPERFVIGRRAAPLNDQLTQSGFRRSQTIAYRPACEHCRACVSVRIKAKEFCPSRNLRRVLEINRDLGATVLRAEATSEQYALLRRYLDARHGDGGMADMMAADYAMMVEDSHVDTHIIEYRLAGGGAAAGGRRPLVAAHRADQARMAGGSDLDTDQAH